MIRNANPKVLVVGDVMLDIYKIGEVTRIAPDGPNPIINIASSKLDPGGAGNVAANLKAMGARVSICGVVGDDASSIVLTNLLDGVHCALITDNSRPTTTKTRFMGYVGGNRSRSCQLLRVDEEEAMYISKSVENKLIDSLSALVSQQNVIIVSDYGKGCLSNNTLSFVFSHAKKFGVPVIVDPKPPKRTCKDYKGATIITPNKKEAEELSSIRIDTENSLIHAAKQIISQAELKHIFVTLDKNGILMCSANGNFNIFPTNPKEVVDVTGAGDVVVAATALVLGSGGTVEEAARVANIAGGLAVRKMGTSVVSKEEILAEFYVDQTKIRNVDGAKKLVELVKKDGGTVVFTNGCFDLLHAGHYQCLKYAKSLGDVLIVGVNSDNSIKKLKGSLRPITPEKERLCVLAGLDVVDCIVVFEEASVLNLIKEIKPNIIVKAADYKKEDVAGREFVESYGGQVKIAPLVDGVSTSKIISRILEKNSK